VSFGLEMAMFRPRGATSLKTHRGKLITVPIGLAEPMREGDMLRCLLMSQGSKRFTM
jgi:hypothetical protein